MCSVSSPYAQNGAVDVRKMLQTLRHVFNWSIKKGHKMRTPFRRQGVAVIEVKRLLAARAG
jgi:hypothetical protein